jgi:hypothetical protein
MTANDFAVQGDCVVDAAVPELGLLLMFAAAVKKVADAFA